MCVITLLPLGKSDFVLTTNRDEAPDRPTLPPAIYKSEGINLLYPKDEIAGGTWVGVSSLKRIVALMNGGFVAHQRKSSYRLSRGVIVLRLLKATDSSLFFDSFGFHDIEPFTIVMLEFSGEPVLQQIVWDGEQLHHKTLPWQPMIWSSAPLYTPEMHAVRRSAFLHTIDGNPQMNAEDIWTFHHSKGDQPGGVSMILETEFVHTKSVTQFIKKEDTITSRYNDLEKENLWEKDFPL